MRAGLFSALLDNELYERAFHEYKKLFQDLSRQISKSNGYKMILKHEDDEKVIYLLNLMKLFLHECSMRSFWEKTEISKMQLANWQTKTESKLHKFTKFKFEEEIVSKIEEISEELIWEK